MGLTAGVFVGMVALSTASVNHEMFNQKFLHDPVAESNDNTTLVFLREGNSGDFVRYPNTHWRYWFGVTKEAGRCSMDCSASIWWLGTQASVPCAAITDKLDEDSCYSCCGVSNCRRGNERWSSFFGVWREAQSGGVERRACVCCMHGRREFGFYEKPERV